MNQSEFVAIACKLLKARESSRVQDMIGFGFVSHWLKNWRDISKPVTKLSNRNRVITFDSHLKHSYFNLLTTLLWQLTLKTIQYYSAGQTSAFFLILDTNLPGTKTH